MNVLIINPDFPPDAGVNTFRVAKFAKYLTEFGCDVYVLATEKKEGRSDTLVPDIESVEEVIRTEVMSERIPLKTDIRWIKPMMKNAVEIINKNGIDVVLHSAPPRLPLLGCKFIKKRTGIPYIMDLRDPFSMEYSHRSPTGVTSRAFYRLTEIVEPTVFECASALVLNTNRMRDIYTEKYPLLEDKMYVIENGYDPEDYDDVKPTQSEFFQIIYPGFFREDMRWFFEPFSRVVDERGDIFFTHFGREEKAQGVKSVVEDLGLESHVSFEGYVDRKEVFSAVKESDLGLAVCRPDDITHVPTKTYDYMGCDVPVLGADDGESAMRDILSEFPNAYLVERSDGESVYDALCSAYEDRPSGLGNPEEAERYTRRNLTRELYKLMQRQTDLNGY